MRMHAGLYPPNVHVRADHRRTDRHVGAVSPYFIPKPVNYWSQGFINFYRIDPMNVNIMNELYTNFKN